MSKSSSQPAPRWRGPPRGRAVVALGLLAGGLTAAALWLHWPDARQPQKTTQAPDAPLSTEEVAKRLGLPVSQVRRLHTERALSNEALVQLPPDKLARALQRLEQPRPDFPQEAALFRMLQYQDEKGVIPTGGLEKAFQQLQAMRPQLGQPMASLAGIPTGPLAAKVAAVDAADADLILPLTAGIHPAGWKWMGPGGIGGRTRALVIHPKLPTTMWAGTAGGGVWKTANGGASWAPLSDFIGSLAVSALVLDPTDPKTLYAGTGEGFYNGDAIRGAGIYKTTDGGTSWKLLAGTATSSFHFVNRLAIAPNGKVLLAATRTSLFRSTNGGTTWTACPAPVNIEVLDARFHPTDSKLGIAGGRNGKAFYSTDAGATWTAATGLPTPGGFGGRVELTYAAANPKVVYASVDNGSGELYRSLDGGMTYKPRNSGTNYLGGQGWYDNAVWAGDPTNVNLVIVGGLDLYRSTNGGTSFTQISQWWLAPASAHADHHFIVAHPKYNGTTNRTVFFCNDGGIYQAANVLTVAGTSGWQELNNKFGVTQYYGAAGHSGTGRVIGGTQDNGTLRFTGSTENWTEMFGGDGGFCASDPTDANFCYGEYVNLQIHRSTNGGLSSSFIHTGIGDAGSAANFIAPFILDPNNPNTLLAGGMSLWRSNNVKALTPAWAAIKPPVGSPISAIAVHKGDSKIIWVGHNNGNVYMTTDGTSASPTWTQVDNAGPTPLPNRYCTRLTIDPTNAKTVYATFGGYTMGNVWQTTNAGSTWTDISAALPAAPVRSLVVHPDKPSFLYIGTEVGIFASETGGASWSPTNEGPTNCSVDELFFMDKTLVAATHGRGLFRIDLSSPAPPPAPPPGGTLPDK